MYVASVIPCCCYGGEYVRYYNPRNVLCCADPKLQGLLDTVKKRSAPAHTVLSEVLSLEPQLQCYLATDFVPVRPRIVADSVLRDDLPGGIRNGSKDSVNLLFLKGHLGDSSKESPALSELIRCLNPISAERHRAALVNVSGCGKTKTLLDLLRVRDFVDCLFCSCLKRNVCPCLLAGSLGILH